MVIAGETCGTQAVVLPLRRISVAAIDIAHGAHLLALAATDACRRIDREFGVGDPILEEEAAQEPEIEEEPLPIGYRPGDMVL